MTHTDLPPDLRELYEKRAAIREYDGLQPRAYAEWEAMKEIEAMMKGERDESETGQAS